MSGRALERTLAGWMGCTGALLALSIASAAAGADPKHIFLDGGADDAELRRTLEVELPHGTLVTSTASADLRLVVRREEQDVVVELLDSAGQNAIRRFAFTDTAEPALRRVVLLATRAEEALAEIVDDRAVIAPALREEIEAPSPARSRTDLIFEAGWSFVFWRTPFRPEPGPTVAGFVSIDRFQFGLRAILGGLPALGRDARNISGDAIELGLLGEFGTSIVSLGPVELRASLGVGGNWVRADVAGQGTGAPFTVQRFQGLELVARVGPTLYVELWPDVVRAWAGGGIEGRLGRLRVALPGLYDADTLDSGGLVPFFQGGVEVRF